MIQHALKAHPPETTLVFKIPKLNLEERAQNKTTIRTLNLTQEEKTCNQQKSTNMDQQTYKKTMEMKQYNSTFWQRIGLIKKQSEEEGWECNIDNCTQTYKTIPMATQHIARQHTEHSARSKQQTECPFCEKLTQR